MYEKVLCGSFNLASASFGRFGDGGLAVNLPVEGSAKASPSICWSFIKSGLIGRRNIGTFHVVLETLAYRVGSRKGLGRPAGTGVGAARHSDNPVCPHLIRSCDPARKRTQSTYRRLLYSWSLSKITDGLRQWWWHSACLLARCHSPFTIRIRELGHQFSDQPATGHHHGYIAIGKRTRGRPRRLHSTNLAVHTWQDLRKSQRLSGLPGLSQTTSFGSAG